MYRYFFRFVVMTLTILSVNLLTGAISNYMVSYKNHYKPVAFTFLGMAITVVIFYPLFIKLESWVKTISMKAVKSGKSVAGKYLGLLFTFLAHCWCSHISMQKCGTILISFRCYGNKA